MTHRQVSPMLPFYANGTLPAAERSAVAGHLAECAACRSELDAYEELAAAVEEVGEEELRPAADLLQRTLAKVESYEQAKARAARRAPYRGGAWTERWAAFWREHWQPLALPARALIAAQAAAVVVLGVLVLAGGRAPWSTQSGPGVEEREGGRARLTLALASEATAGQVQGLLREVGARVVDGPSAAGFYVVELGAGSADSAVVDAALAELRSRPDLVLLAERADSDPDAARGRR